MVRLLLTRSFPTQKVHALPSCSHYRGMRLFLVLLHRPICYPFLFLPIDSLLPPPVFLLCLSYIPLNSALPSYTWSSHLICGPPILYMVLPSYTWSSHLIHGPPILYMVLPSYTWSSHLIRGPPTFFYGLAVSLPLLPLVIGSPPSTPSDLPTSP